MRAKETEKARKGAWGMPVALGGDEGRDKLRKAAGRGKCPAIRGCPNGGTRRERSRHRAEGRAGRTRGTETSQYPQEKKTKVIAQVVASERAAAQTGAVRVAAPGVVGPAPARALSDRGTRRKAWPQRVTAPYPKSVYACQPAPEYRGTRGILRESAGTIPQG